MSRIAVKFTRGYVLWLKFTQVHGEPLISTRKSPIPFRKTTQADRDSALQATAHLWNEQSLTDLLAASGLDEEGLSFSQIEQRAREVAQAVTRRVAEELLLWQRKKMPTEMPCQQCGKACQ